jgi:hypothetical protein
VTAGPREEEIRSGHTEISWSIALELDLERPLQPEAAAARVGAAWPVQRLGTLPAVEEVAAALAGERLGELADRPYGPGDPLARIAVVQSPEPRLLLAGYHGALDGLGLLALAEVALGEPLRTSARGVDPRGRHTRAGVSYLAQRLAQALAAPPSRFAPDRHGRELGDHLCRLDAVSAGSTGTAEIVVAAVRALRRWNRSRGRSANRPVVAVGASLRSGLDPVLAESSAWFRLSVKGDDPDEVRRQLRRSSPEPHGSPTMSRPLARRVARVLASRTGSSLLVSNLGRLDSASAATTAEAAAFYPSVHGRSGIAVGAVSVRDRLTLTLRARRGEFSLEAAERLLAWVQQELPIRPLN